MRRERGFTLIGVLIALAIVAILAAIAVPWWGRYLYRARRTDGQKLLMHVAQAEERYYTDYNYYPLSAASLGYTTATPLSTEGYYQLTLVASPTAAAGQGYLAKAAPQGAQSNDDCGTLSIDDTGQKKPLPTDTAANHNGRCW